MPPHPAALRLAAPAAAALAMLAAPLAGFGTLALAASAAPRPAAQAVSVPSAGEGDAAGAAAALAAAKGRFAKAALVIDDLKRELLPGHLTDPMPETDRVIGLASLRTDYADAQRRAAGYRATLGDQHPTLVAAEQLMEELRTELLDTTRKALASAERDAAEARTDMAAAERQIGAATARSRAPEPTAADATGSVVAPPRPSTNAASPLSLPPATLSPAATSAQRPSGDAAATIRPDAPKHPSLALLLAAVTAAAMLAVWAGLKLRRRRRPRVAPLRGRRVEPALVTPVVDEPVPMPSPAVQADAVPVLQRWASQQAGEELSGAAGVAAADLHATLRAAFGETAQARMTVLVAPAAGLAERDADAAAVTLALASAAAGHRPLLMEARAAGRLRGAFVAADASPMLIEVGGTLRTLYRLGPAGALVAVLPGDAGEAEVALAADARTGTARLRGFDAFDTVILVGDDPTALAASADLVLIAAPVEATPAALAESARPLAGSGRPCGAVLIDASPGADAAAIGRPAPPRRRRIMPAAAAAARLGLRGSIEPPRRRLEA